jgi:ATP-binding cassette, subfamily B, bacterial HlyB/CyaB
MPVQGQTGGEPFAEQVRANPAPAQAPAQVPAQAPDAALVALVLIARLHHLPADASALHHALALSTGSPIDKASLLLAARKLGLRARWVHSAADRVPTAPLPALAHMRDGSWAVVARADSARVLLQRFGPQTPSGGTATIEPLESFCQTCFDWFVPAIIRYRKLLSEVLVVSLFLQLFALVSPLFFQVVMDKVLVHRGTSTLDVVVAALVLVMVFETVLSGLRSYLFSHTTNRIDVELGSKLFGHLLNLPLAYFEARRVGDSVARVRELENIRAFLTGNALTLVLDVLFSVVFLAVMFAYSAKLTLVVLLSLPLYVLLTLAVVPPLRARLDEKFARGAENQAMLVESVGGVATVKAGALEPLFAKRWDQQLAAYVAASFRAQTWAAAGQEGVGLIGKLTSAAILWFGAHAVMQNELTVGMFVAFTMFANRISTPIMRMAQMWSDFQQAALSVRRLGDILNTPCESPPAQAANLPRLEGAVRFTGVGFRYGIGRAPVLEDISLDIGAGEFIGVVGRSGSGKSTLAKLIQRLYVPEQGRVSVDGIDLTTADAAALRRQVGVVLQDTQLFNRSIRDNIAIADPGAPLESIVRVARLTGAHEFVSEMPQGYDTPVGEQGIGLSGGQRQRIAIARALFTDPRILIFDEATSALDYESESILQRNMVDIAQGRTVIVIAHRLSAVRQASRIVVLDRGRVAQVGSHEALLQAGGPYADLWHAQHGVAPNSAPAAAEVAAAAQASQAPTAPTPQGHRP